MRPSGPRSRDTPPAIGGELDDHDRAVNEDALRSGDRLFSVYRDQRDTRFYIITEADRRLTTVLLPEDY